MSSDPILFITCTLFFIIVMSIGIPAAFGQSTGNGSYEGKILLSPPATITTPGTYILSSDIATVNGTDAITILSGDVFLDGMGHILETNGSDSNQTSGIKVEGRDSSLKNISISSVKISGFNSGIRIKNTDLTKIQNCTLSSNQVSGIALVNVSSVTINKSEISTTQPKGDGSGGDGIDISDSNNVNIKSVKVTKSGSGGVGDGVKVARSSIIVLDTAVITISAGSGFSTQGNSSGFIINNSIISENGANGISLSAGCTGPQISNSQIRDNTLTGIEITSAGNGILAGNLIENNQVGLSLSNAEDFSASRNNIKNNKINLDITGNSPTEYWHHIDKTNLADGRPIWYLLGSRDTSISSADSPSCIYAVNCSNLTVADQVLSKNGAGIFLINTDSATISRISALDNTFGLRIGYGSRNITVADSSAETNLIAGYAVAGSQDITFSSCSAQNNLVGFFCTETNKLHIKESNANNQQGLRRRGPSGFLISGCTNVSIMNSTAKQNQFDGLYLKDSPDTLISGSTLSSNDIAGIASLAEGTRIINSTFSANGAGGVLLYGNSSAMQSNKIQDNKGRGLIIDSATKTKIWNNYFNNTRNVEMTGTSSNTEWNSTPHAGDGITGHTILGGNYWGSPDRTGYSDICTPNTDGFCNASYKPGLDGVDQYPVSFTIQNTTNNEISTLSISGTDYDIDQNGQVNLQDVVALMQGIVSGTMTEPAYDFSKDGRVNLQDVVAFFNHIS
jgi:parallel beta-helix repeat protein